MTEELKKQVKKFAISYWRKRNRIGDNFSVLDLINFTTDFVTEIATKELEAQIEKMKSDVLNLIKGRMNEDIDQNLIERMADKWGLKYE